jgi:putative membrane protein insertion efficiency factor
MGAIDRALALVLRGVVALYRRLLSPLLPSACRYYPTCSAYADEALSRQGFVVGSVTAMRRIARCHPFAPGGVDPVPPSEGAQR